MINTSLDRTLFVTLTTLIDYVHYNLFLGGNVILNYKFTFLTRNVLIKLNVEVTSNNYIELYTSNFI